MKERGSKVTVSVIIPAYRAWDTISGAINSICACGHDLSHVEAVISSDDGTDYTSYVPKSLNVIFSKPGPIASGPGPARNRALELATGDYFAFIDADDLWSPGYLRNTMHLASSNGIAFSTTRIVNAGHAVLSLPDRGHLDFATLAATGASFRPVVHRDLVGRFHNVFAQDILHVVELVALAGGCAPVSDATYILQLRDGSVTSSETFATRLNSSYREIISMIKSGETRVEAAFHDAATSVFEAKIALNQKFLSQTEQETYYEFLATYMASQFK